MENSIKNQNFENLFSEFANECNEEKRESLDEKLTEAWVELNLKS